MDVLSKQRISAEKSQMAEKHLKEMLNMLKASGECKLK